ncbi:MAG TPA: hypothetical protein VG754_09170, partial [Verrucomicrobiae bacterium]|nr:hypothetical protein [Verrucomicrobiae bacterium]
DDSQGDARYAEAQEIRSDAKYNLPAGAHMLYAGDWNLFNGSGENAYKCLTGQTTPDGINWADTNSIWANTNSTQGYDPTSKTSPPTTTIFANSSKDSVTYLYDDSTDAGSFAMSSRLDVQLPNALMFAAYNSKGGVQLASDTNDPYDSSNFPSSQYQYAFEVFGNNGTTPRGSTVTYSGNHALDDVTNAATVKLDMMRNTTNSLGSDHYPIVGDYNIVVPASAPARPVLTPQGFGTNGSFQFKVASTTNTGFEIQASTNLLNWTNIASGYTGTNGLLLFQDTNAAGFSKRFYRVLWPIP